MCIRDSLWSLWADQEILRFHFMLFRSVALRTEVFEVWRSLFMFIFLLKIWWVICHLNKIGERVGDGYRWCPRFIGHLLSLFRLDSALSTQLILVIRNILVEDRTRRELWTPLLLLAVGRFNIGVLSNLVLLIIWYVVEHAGDLIVHLVCLHSLATTLLLHIKLTLVALVHKVEEVELSDRVLRVLRLDVDRSSDWPYLMQALHANATVSYTHLTLPTICSV